MTKDTGGERLRKVGQSLVEMALVLPLLLLLFAGIADFARAFNSYIVITNAAREGARFAARMDSYDPVSVDGLIRQTVEQEAANSGVDLGDPCTASITIIPVYTDWQAKQPITVTVRYTMTTIFTGVIGLAEIPMQSHSVMVMFGDPTN